MQWLAALTALLTITPYADVARAQGAYARGDATCDVKRSAADIVGTVLGLTGNSPCGNHDCDRDGVNSAADVQCAAGCLFGECPVPPEAPAVTSIIPASAPGVSPLSSIRIEGQNFGDPLVPKRVVIGGIVADAELLADGSLEVIVPFEVSPGPTTLVVFDGEIAGPPLPITIAPSVPVGEPDSLDGVLTLADQTLAALLALDLEGAYELDGTILRQKIADVRADLAAQQAALATDPVLTPEVRAFLDEAIDASGIAEQLRASIADTEQVAAEAGSRSPGRFAPTLRVVGRAGRTLRVVGGTIRVAAAAAGAAGTAAGVTISAPVIIGITVIGTIIAAAGGYYAGQESTRNALEPQIIDITYRDANRVRRSHPTVGGTIEVYAADTFPDTALLLLTRFGEFRAAFVAEQPDQRFIYQVPREVGLCGKVNIVLRGGGGEGRDSNVVSSIIQPVVLDTDPARAYQGELLLVDVDGTTPCDGVAAFAKSENQQFKEQPLQDRGGGVTSAVVPKLAPGTDYRVLAKVDGLPSEEDHRVEIVAAPTGMLRCARTRINVPPRAPTDMLCTLTISGERLPQLSVSWRSSKRDVATVDNVDAEETTVRAVADGTSEITALLAAEPEVIAESNSVAVAVTGPLPGLLVTCTPPALLVRPGTPSTGTCRLSFVPDGPIPAGTRISWVSSDPLIATVSDTSTRVVTVTAGAIGSATIKARLVAESQVLVESGEITITVDDETPPTVTLTSTSPMMVRRGSTIDVRARSDDNVQSNRLVLDTTGDAVESVSPSRELPCLLDRRCTGNFTIRVKDSGFTNTLIGVVVEATDGRGNTGRSNVLNFQVADDSNCPQVSIQAPADGARVRAGDTVQISVRVSDNREGDTGVRRVLVNATGAAVAMPPTPMEVTLPQPLPDATRLVTFKVADDLSAISDRTITITANAADEAGNLCEQPQTVTIMAGGAPSITGVAPNPVNAGANITITGQAFGAEQGSSTVMIGGAVAAVGSWSNSAISAQVPNNLSGDVQVSVTVDGETSNAVPVTVLGTGQIQITLIWSDTNDLDLHLIEPGGEEIFYANRSSSSGGQLDVDANASCGSATTSPRENIFYPAGSAPTGEYRVRVVFFAACPSEEPRASSGVSVTATVDGRFMTLINSASISSGELTATFSR